MKLSEWAKMKGMSRLTAYRMFRAGKLPVAAEQMPTGRIYVSEKSASQKQAVAIYARVSSHDQRGDLERQVARLAEYAAKNGMVVGEIVKEVESGLNGRRSGLLKLLKKTNQHVLVEHRDRLCRFGFDYLEAALNQNGRQIFVADEAELTDDIVRDLHEVIVSMCARLYGKRSAKNKAARAVAALEDQPWAR